MPGEELPVTKRSKLDLAIHFKEHYDTCTKCGKPFGDGDTQHIGFDKSGDCMNVCDGCESVLTEVSHRFSYLPRLYTVPKSDDVLWRYMDFPKFVALLRDRALFFAAAELFKDPFEGAKGLKSRERELGG